ncbi:uncharacterized protein EV154DRAFT_594004 [Mucor mucedo]|uniref:uncharacterized protein n=1 Tax=Mucor mucedo TaxID=29922 RepID=UPI00221E5769|nr:uncharacterized protein EV154DRAFT_594004 [Mucor mucedo]KAI7888269.1 hypothetical protein EV154DRAFT_594004 [Mucor mucedo]
MSTSSSCDITSDFVEFAIDSEFTAEIEPLTSTDYILNFSEYVDHCLNASSFDEKLELHFDAMTTNVFDDSNVKFTVDLDIQEEVQCLPCEVNIDAIITNCTSTVPILHNVSLDIDLCPAKSMEITRNEYGCYTYEGDKYEVKKIPLTLIGLVSGEAKLSVYILFPRMICPERISAFLSDDEQRDFTDEPLLPALQKSDFNRMDKSYKAAVSRGRGCVPNNIVDGDDLNKTVKTLRRMIVVNESRLGKYKDFVFVTSAFGFKRKFRGTSFRDVLSSTVDWINFETRTENGDSLISFVKTNEMTGIASIFCGEKPKVEPMNMVLANFGGLKALSKSKEPGHASKFIVYSDVKIPFVYGKKGFNGIPAERWEPNNVLTGRDQVNGLYQKAMEWYAARLEESEQDQYTLRAEGRFLASTINSDFVNFFKNTFSDLIPGSCYHFRTQDYMSYISCRLNLLDEMAQALKGRKDIRSLSGVALLSFMMNSLMHPGNYKRTDSRNFVSKNRDKSNGLCFIPGAFTNSDEALLEFSGTFDLQRLKKMFYNIQVIVEEFREGPSDCMPLFEIWSWGAPFLNPERLNWRDLCLYNRSKEPTIANYAMARSILLRFMELFWEEYFGLLPSSYLVKTKKGGMSDLSWDENEEPGPFACNVTKEYSPFSKVSELMSSLIPTPCQDMQGDLGMIKDLVGLNHHKYLSFGSRVAFLELFLAEGVEFEEIVLFYERLMLVTLLHTRVIPRATKARFMRKDSNPKMIFLTTLDHKPIADPALFQQYLLDHIYPKPEETTPVTTDRATGRFKKRRIDNN